MKAGDTVKMKGAKGQWRVIRVIPDHPIFKPALYVEQDGADLKWIVPADRCEKIKGAE